MSTKTMKDAPQDLNHDEACAWLRGYAAAVREISKTLGTALANLDQAFEESEEGIKTYQEIQEWRKNA